MTSGHSQERPRLLDYFFVHQPVTSCFVLSLFLITVTLCALGIYVRGREHMPDLDAMKNWNAYIGKMNSRDYCFKLMSNESSTFQNMFPAFTNGTIYEGNNSSCAVFEGLKGQDEKSEYGTVHINFDFYVHRNIIEARNMSSGILHAAFTGEDVGTQIKDQSTGKRIDSKISIFVWINMQRIDNYTAVCTGHMCKVGGCFLITAPLSSVPTRMPQIQGNFSFSSKLLNSGSRRPSSCECETFSNTSYTIFKHHITRCTDIQTTFEVHKSSSGNKAYGIINIELSEDDRKRASQHMFLASIMVLLLALAIITIKLCKKKV